MKLSRSGYHSNEKRVPSNRKQEYLQLVEKIKGEKDMLYQSLPTY